MGRGVESQPPEGRVGVASGGGGGFGCRWVAEAVVVKSGKDCRILFATSTNAFSFLIS